MPSVRLPSVFPLCRAGTQDVSLVYYSLSMIVCHSASPADCQARTACGCCIYIHHLCIYPPTPVRTPHEASQSALSAPASPIYAAPVLPSSRLFRRDCISAPLNPSSPLSASVPSSARPSFGTHRRMPPSFPSARQPPWPCSSTLP